MLSCPPSYLECAPQMFMDEYMLNEFPKFKVKSQAGELISKRLAKPLRSWDSVPQIYHSVFDEPHSVHRRTINPLPFSNWGLVLRWGWEPGEGSRLSLPSKYL